MSKKTAEDYFKDGTNFIKNKKFDEAIKAFNKVLTTNPDVYQVFLNLGIIYHNQSNFDLAIENFQKASEINPEDFQIFNNIGNSYLKKRDFTNALENFKIAFSL